MREYISSICILLGFMIGLVVGITVERARITEAIDNLSDDELCLTVDKIADNSICNKRIRTLTDNELPLWYWAMKYGGSKNEIN